MARQYLRKAEPYDQNPNSDWVMMTGIEFYRFINSPEGKGRYFIKWDDLVIEASKAQYDDWLREEKHSRYLRSHESEWETLSLYTDLSQEGKNGEELIPDPSTDVELQAMDHVQREALTAALHQLDCSSFYLIYSLYLASSKKTEGELAVEIGVSQPAVHRRKEKILSNLKFLVIKSGKNRQ